MRELEERLAELEGGYRDLAQSYESLQLAYSNAKQELEILRRGDIKPEISSATNSYHSVSNGWEEFHMETLNLLPFNVSAFCYD
jgi:hypothetical protein